MGRRYKLIISFFISVFMMTNIVFAYEMNNFNLIEANCFTAEIKNIKLDSIKFGELRNQQSLLALNSNNTADDEYNNKEITETKKEIISLNDEQLNLLSKLVAAEARGESYEGQVAVAAVVLNRVQDDRFPNSIEGVIYQKNAFSVVKNGYINIQATEESYNAAKEALYGNDPTNDAIYFWNPDISTCSWINTLDPHLRIGNHVFAR